MSGSCRRCVSRFLGGETGYWLAFRVSGAGVIFLIRGACGWRRGACWGFLGIGLLALMIEAAIRCFYRSCWRCRTRGCQLCFQIVQVFRASFDTRLSFSKLALSFFERGFHLLNCEHSFCLFFCLLLLLIFCLIFLGRGGFAT